MWWWVLIWVVLVVGAGAYLGSRAWGVWGQAKELGAEVQRASETLSALESQAERLRERPLQPDLAVFGDPRALRRQRLATVGALREQRHKRRVRHRPRWARHLD